MKSRFLTSTCLLLPLLSIAAELRTEHTYGLAEGESRPAATIDDARWLAGTWKGTAFGQRTEETWNAPSAGTMVGMFKLFGDDGVSFYELMLLTVEDGTLHLLVKHFNPDFTAWEEKPDYVRFSLVKLEPDALHFGGLSFYRRSDDLIEGYIVMRNSEGISEKKMLLERANDAK